MATNYLPGGNYFPMANEHHQAPRWDLTKEYIMQYNKKRQVAMGQQLSRIAKDEYGEDILRHMLNQEVCSAELALQQLY